jgi:hypothetical protein
MSTRCLGPTPDVPSGRGPMRLGLLAVENDRYQGTPVIPNPGTTWTSRSDKRRAKPRKGRRTRNRRGWYGYFKHSRPFAFISIDGLIRRPLRAILRRQQRRPGFGRCHEDHNRWPNAFFAERGLFTMTEDHAQASQSRC